MLRVRERKKRPVLLELSLPGGSHECLHRNNGSKNTLGRLGKATGLSEQKAEWLKKDSGSVKEIRERPGANFCWFIFFFSICLFATSQILEQLAKYHANIPSVTTHE